ncbi:avidin/streptavidin family protein [Undibacter mobilis]|nr:avidin/streptavidin family protein [Undibacter mobilis]
MALKSIGRMAIGVVLGAATLSTAHAQAETKFAAGLSWVNEDGSVLTVTSLAPSGQLSGTVTTQSGCGAKKAQPMTGWYYAGGTGGALTFTVNWEGCNSATAWTAQYSNATGAFRALWHLAMASGPVWNGIVAGANTFILQPVKRP